MPVVRTQYKIQNLFCHHQHQQCLINDREMQRNNFSDCFNFNPFGSWPWPAFLKTETEMGPSTISQVSCVGPILPKMILVYKHRVIVCTPAFTNQTLAQRIGKTLNWPRLGPCRVRGTKNLNRANRFEITNCTTMDSLALRHAYNSPSGIAAYGMSI